ncbi:bestrophin family protein [Lignipirellula cremea]|uniref:Bestrophin, RFP-TM, chloride channel n=1 Tax=Lignipirellula cremea TaxID=2528010 RepID=A0A518DM00_9BACT|nr:bestrophin family ion channel [Lignipirellula cremea]QDU92870.1 Bestrophin, RFP-TM, chloride channel [Lignipirellula cremea]
MYLARTFTLRGLIQFGWKQCLLFAVVSTLVCLVYDPDEFQHIAIPFLPLATLGTAMAIILGFRNNSAYDRWWEARKIWGGLVNQSRTWAMQLVTCLTPGEGEEKEAALARQEMVHRQIGYLNALRLQLRRQDNWAEVTPLLPERERDQLPLWKNKATQINVCNAEQLREAWKRGWIDSFHHVALLDTLEQFYELQGKCERIKNTPLPRQYSFFTTLFVWIFILLLPFGFVKELHWWTVPMSVLIGWIFMALEQVGRYTEEPFNNFVHDVPMTALCRTIEIDLRQTLGETELPPPVEPVRNILM